MNILIIGGTNFIGVSVIRHLSEMGHDVTIFHRGKTVVELPPGVNEILGDRIHLPEMKSNFQRLSPQVVLDMFAYTEQDALTLMNTFKGIQARIVAISSMDVYRAYEVLLGKESDIVSVPLSEDSPLRQQLYPFREMTQRALNAPADYEKILVERVVMDSDLPGTIVRLPMVYGARDPLHRLFPYLKRMDDNRPAILLPENVAKWRGAYGYVENIAYAIALAVTKEQATNRIYHVADLEVVSEAERLKRLGKVAGWQGKIVAVPKEYLPADWHLPFNTDQDWFVDTTRIHQELGYSEVVPHEEALRRTINWQRMHPPAEIPPWTGLELLDYATEDEILTKELG